MSEVKQIKVSLIDPTSPVNVRRQGVEQNVDRIKMSIEKHGYMQEYAIVVRSHPTPNAEYDYQHVSGQCRLKACIELGLKEIPAFIMELTDEEAIQRSWLENESHEPLTFRACLKSTVCRVRTAHQPLKAPEWDQGSE